MLLSRNKKKTKRKNVYPCKPQFYYKKWGVTGLKSYRYVFGEGIKPRGGGGGGGWGGGGGNFLYMA